MPWRPPKSDQLVRHDPGLDFLRDAVAEVSDDRTFGYVVFRVAPMWTRTGGHLWWTKWDGGREYVEFIETVWLDRGDVGDVAKAVGEAGIATPPSAWIDNLREGRYLFQSPPEGPAGLGRLKALALKWLYGEARDQVQRTWGYGV